MKVILLKDVKKVGRKFEAKEVSSGYALNFLIPRKLAEAATASNEKRLGHLKAKADGEMKVREDLLMKNMKNIEGKTIEMSESANDKGHLFKGIHNDEIVAAIKNQTELDLSADHLMIEKPIKEVGEHDVEVKVQDKMVKFKLVVTAA